MAAFADRSGPSGPRPRSERSLNMKIMKIHHDTYVGSNDFGQYLGQAVNRQPGYRLGDSQSSLVPFEAKSVSKHENYENLS